MPLTVNHYYEKNQKAHVHVSSYNYAALSIISNVSTVFIIASKSTSIPDLSLFPSQSSSDTVRI